MFVRKVIKRSKTIAENIAQIQVNTLLEMKNNILILTV